MNTGGTGRLRGTALAAGLWLAASGCMSLFEVALPEGGAVGPSPAAVEALLAQDRVREALDAATALVERYPTPALRLLLARCQWRNGRFIEAEAGFRRGAEAGLSEGYLGLAALQAERGRWERSRELALRSAEGEAAAEARALLAGLAWRRGDLAEAVRQLEAWSDSESRRDRAAVAAAMAAAARNLTGPPLRWRGAETTLPLQELPGEGYVVAAAVGAVPARLLLDLSAPQSWISAELARRAGLEVSGAEDDEPVDLDLPGRPGAVLARQVSVSRTVLGRTQVEQVVVGVGPTPPGVDGVLAADLLAAARWRLDPGGGELTIAPAGAVRDPDQEGFRDVVAWVDGRLLLQGLWVQLFVNPRVEGVLATAGLDLAAPSRIEAGRAAVPRPGRLLLPVRLGGWQGELEWELASLELWAAGGRVAPEVVLGGEFLDRWILHWVPEVAQLRLQERRSGTPPG